MLQNQARRPRLTKRPNDLDSLSAPTHRSEELSLATETKQLQRLLTDCLGSVGAVLAGLFVEPKDVASPLE